MRPRVGVSSCLLGEQVRFDGGHRRDAYLTEVLGPHVDFVPFCPEMAIGLGAPRETLRLTAADHLINRSGTADHTAAMAALPLPAQIDGYVFKAKSPSCGIRGIPRYAAGERPADRRGRGVYAARLMAACPLLPVEDERRLTDDGPRAAFTERIFAWARLRELFAGDWRPRDLAAFHARHELQLLAHDPARCRRAGRLVAVAGQRPRAEAEAGYRELFCTALAATATRDRHANALLHALGQVSDQMDDAGRAGVSAQIESYRRGRAPLGEPVALLARHARAGGWLAEQTYLQPMCG